MEAVVFDVPAGGPRDILDEIGAIREEAVGAMLLFRVGVACTTSGDAAFFLGLNGLLRALADDEPAPGGCSVGSWFEGLLYEKTSWWGR